MNRLIVLLTVICCSISFFRVPVQAVPAFPGEISYVQPDGSVVKYHLRGDERRHWMESTEGYLLRRAADGYLKYAILDGDTLAASQLPYTGNDAAARGKARLLRLADVPQRSLWGLKAVGDPSLNNTSSFPTKGQRKLLMLLVNFADTQTSVPVANFDEMMNGSGYNGTGSFRDFYLENSYGQLDVETTVVGWIQLPMSKLDYGTDDMTALIRDAIGLVDDEIDFRQFDNDGDGILDGLSIIHQGYGQEVTGSTQDIWSHSADLLADVQADGVRVRTYTIQPELLYDDIQMTVGVFCHEFGHNLGAPDFYDTDYESSGGNYEGTGQWDLMSGGSWGTVNVSGDSPSHINMWQKMQFGWVEPRYLTEDCTVGNIPAASDEPVGYIMNTQREGDYFVIENRVREGFDRSLPGSGLVIYHADEQRIASSVYSNSVNIDYRQGLYTVCASATTDPGTTPGSYGDINSGGAVFPGTYGIAEFSDATTPSAHSNDGKYSYAALRNIGFDGAEASFDFVAGDVPDTVRNFTATARRGIVTLTWDAPQAGSVETYRIFRGDNEIARTGELQYIDEGLTETVATYKVDVLYADGKYSPFVESTVKVPENRVDAINAESTADGLALTFELDDRLTRINNDIEEAMDNSLLNSIDGSEVEVAQYFSAADLATYVGYSIERLSIFPFTSQRQVTYKLRVYRIGSDGEELMSERNVSEYGSSQWTTFKLTTPVTIEAGYGYMIGFAAQSTLGYVAVACDGSVFEEGLGNLVRVDGEDEWRMDLLDGNVFVYATLGSCVPAVGDFVPGEEPVFDPGFDPVLDVAFPIGFNVYRNGELLGYTSTGIYIDDDASVGDTYTYGVACLYQGNNESRLLERQVNVLPVGIADAEADGGVRVSASGREIRVVSLDDAGQVAVYAADGTAVAADKDIVAGSTVIIGVAAPGVYIVKFTNNDDLTTTYKIIVK